MKKLNKKQWIIGIVCVLVVFLVFEVFQVCTAFSKVYYDGDPHNITMDSKEYEYNDDLFNILCLGVDKEGGLEKEQAIGQRGQADAIYLVSINKKTKDLFVTAIPRDTMVDLEIYDENDQLQRREFGQITLQHAYGSSEKKSIEYMAKQVSHMFNNIPIHRYAVINYLSIPALNDLVGGVDVVMGETVDKDLQTWSEDFRPYNEVHLDGFKAYYYLRERDTNVYASSEDRANRQKTYITSYLQKAKLLMKQDPFSIFSIYRKAKKEMVTNLKISDFIALIPYVSNMELDTMYTVPGDRIRGVRYEEYHTKMEEMAPFIRDVYYKEKKGN